jgi:predicted AAA+ superfamily ATPase
LSAWKRQSTRKPVLLDGARQVGKSWLIDQLFGPREFRKVHKLDFRAEPGLASLFSESLEPRTILSNIELHFNRTIEIEQDLIFFDEVGECQAAVDSLKYFAEQLPQAFVCASGSNIGLLDSFPVGKVQQLELFPLCFEEFIMATGQARLLQAFRELQRSQTVHQMLWSQLLDFYFVGGMPEAVASWFEVEGSAHERAQNIVRIHRDQIAGYQRDFGKYAGKHHAQHIEAVFQNVPRQLAASQDGSVQRFKFKNVIEKKQRYRELQGPIDWLEKARLVWKCYPIDGKPEVPLLARARANIFKLYLFDVGLLGYMLGMTYADQRAQSLSYKGYIAENFVLTELRAHVGYPLYSWEQARAEVEFLHRCADGEVIPVEVKSGKRTQARSLRSYIDRYAPTRAIKLIGGLGGDPDGPLKIWPLYYAQYLRDL